MSAPRWPLAAILAAILAVTVAAVGAAYAMTPRVPDASTATQLSASQPMALVIGGTARPLADGELIPVAKGLVARATLTAVGPGQHVLRLAIQDDGGAAVRDATVRTVVEMRYMEHGQVESVGLPSGDGAYVAPIVFEMPGEWRISLTVTAGTTRGTVRFDVDEFR